MSAKRKILVIDDSELALDVARSALEAAGFEVVTRDTPFGSGAMILRERPDLVLLDVTMPALSGEDVVRHVRETVTMQDTCLVLFSDRPEKELRAIAQRSGADGWISKSADQEALVARVNAFLRTVRVKE